MVFALLQNRVIYEGQMKIEFLSIGVIHSPFTDLAQMPIQPRSIERGQPRSKTSAAGTVEVFPEYAEGLRDLDGFSHIILLYHLHKAAAPRLLVTPFLDSQPHGVFATRAPVRPNPIGFSVVRLSRIQGNLLYVEGLDILDGTPLLDIKPYVPSFDERAEHRIGWLEGVDGNASTTLSDDRFNAP
jgi:tRNA-Thr(GGU) m(6)t(6)A37 methyltransferase TsaA